MTAKSNFKTTHRPNQKSKSKQKSKALVDGWIIVDKRFGPVVSTFSKERDVCVDLYEKKFGILWIHANQHGTKCEKVSLHLSIL